jgi:hypothetical protein
MPADEHASMHALGDDQIQQFIRDGFVRIDGAFPRELADEARTILWRDTGCDPQDRATWTKPVIRLSGYKDAPFLKAERTPVLHAAFDQIVGEGRWRLGSLGFGGTFVVRFPHPDEPHQSKSRSGNRFRGTAWRNNAGPCRGAGSAGPAHERSTRGGGYRRARIDSDRGRSSSGSSR